MTIKFLVFHLLFMTSNLIQISVNKLISLVFLVEQCLVIENNSVFPPSTYPVNNRYFSNVKFMKEYMKRIICKINHNKAHGHGMISIHMLKISGNAIKKTLHSFQKLLKIWNISGWFEKRKRTSNNIVQSFIFQSATRFSNVSYMITSILGLLLFLIHINNLPMYLQPTPKVFYFLPYEMSRKALSV